MLLRRVTEHVKTQNWTAVAIDFVIVVVGVFIGIQVSNWNEKVAFMKREQTLMHELRGEVVQNIAEVQSKGNGFLVSAAAARRVLDAIDRGTESCTDDCWAIVVDLMHASQWQQIFSNWSTYDELRRDGLPSDRQIIELIERYKKFSYQAGLVLAVQPRYRSLVRGLIPIKAQDAYWERCYSIEEAIETYLDPCPVPDELRLDPKRIGEILANPEIASTLREWTTIVLVVGATTTEPQKALGDEILQRIDEAIRTKQ